MQKFLWLVYCQESGYLKLTTNTQTFVVFALFLPELFDRRSLKKLTRFIIAYLYFHSAEFGGIVRSSIIFFIEIVVCKILSPIEARLVDERVIRSNALWERVGDDISRTKNNLNSKIEFGEVVDLFLHTHRVS